MATELKHTDAQMAGPSNHPPEKVKPKKKPLCKRFGHYCYNKEKKTCMNRSGKNCVLLLIYYILFIGFMTILFIFFWFGIGEQTLKLETSPYMRIQHSDSPCPTIVPTLISSSQELGIYYFLSGEQNMQANRYVDDIKRFYEDEENKCKKLDKCPFSKEDYGPCGEEDYSYGNKTPCIFIKLNVIDNFSPTAYGTYSNIPISTPKELMKKIDVSRKTLWAHCKGKTPYDTEFIGRVKYYPEQAFNDDFFPTSDESEVNPFLAVQLVELTSDRVLTIECRIFGNNFDTKLFVQAYLYVGV